MGTAIDRRDREAIRQTTMDSWVSPDSTDSRANLSLQWIIEITFVRVGHKSRTNTMPRSQRNDNFIDKSFTVMADILLKILPTNKQSKEAFAYYRDGMSAQAEGEYAEALENYYEALKLEQDANDRSYIFYNIGLIHASNGEHDRALDNYYKAIELNPRMPQALNNIAVIHHYKGDKAAAAGDEEEAETMYDKAAEYWKQAIRLAPNNYIEAQNWLKITGRSKMDIFF